MASAPDCAGAWVSAVRVPCTASDKRWCGTGGAALGAAGWNDASAVLGVVTALAAEPQMAGEASMHRVATALGLPARSLLRWLEQSDPPVFRLLG